MRLTSKQYEEMAQAFSKSFSAGEKCGGPCFGRSMVEACAPVLLAEPTWDEVCAANNGHGPSAIMGQVSRVVSERLRLVMEKPDRTVERLQKWFECHGHPEFCLDPNALEQIAAIVLSEHEKRKKA